MFKKLSLISIVSFFVVFSMAIPGITQEISETELEKAAMAYMEIAMISQEFQESVQETADPEARQEMQREANDKMIRAVEETGLDVQQYNNIMGEVSKNQSLAEEFSSKLQNLN